MRGAVLGVVWFGFVCVLVGVQAACCGTSGVLFVLEVWVTGYCRCLVGLGGYVCFGLGCVCGGLLCGLVRCGS